MIKCWLHQRTISRSVDENAPLPPSAQAHLAGCSACRRRYDTEREIVRQLSAGAASHKRHQPSPFLQSRIMARIGAPQSAAGSTPRPVFLRWPVAVAAACVVLTMVFLRPSPPAPVPVASHPSQQIAFAVPLKYPDATQLAEWATNIDKPLQTEMHSVFHDAQSAVTAVADNFLPPKLRQTIIEETSSRN